ncbi:SSI family serine proteinase inhibitor [Blastococcus sp. LR1]|uniref:SSI family serine proteinase inhibitor n=1 Tax=Blastococcus sp. LR1 TaxID=2877000 RepID=UPI001CCEB545|nr:SSI family serine proteinase inhibitor [Blastococcus sp. LR1]MCA0143418.1 subtilase-type protease inhibitor [Blastococcus sp. LR1]
MRRLLPLVVLPLLLLGACGSQPADDADEPAAGSSADPGTTTGIEQTQNDLRIDVDRGDGSPPESWTLVCAGFVEGTHPQAQAACDHLAGMTEPFAPLADDLMCTEQYGGDQTARITGRWAGQAVELDLSRRDGCRISQWDSFGPVLPIPVGVGQPSG